MFSPWMLVGRPGRSGRLGFWELKWMLMFWYWILEGQPGRVGQTGFGNL